MKRKVILGLSGGVDSSVAALLLQEEYEVVCCFMRNWDAAINNDYLGNPTFEDSVCPQEQDYLDAMAVADKLGLPLLRVDFVEEYWNTVFSYFLDEYKAGRTPNPDIMCNNHIKFKAFLDYAEKHEVAYIAMGHYALRVDTPNGVRLIRATDTSKDQTYFLCMLKQYQIEKCLFPIGHLLKTEVRDIAIKNDMITATKKDSTGICFIGERKFQAFLSNYLPAEPGKMVRLDGTEIGLHQGLMYYTIGQRKGLGIGGLADYSLEPWFVVGKDLDNNELIVEQGHDHEYLYSNRCKIDNLNWILDIPISNKQYQAKFRYREKDNDVTIHLNEGWAMIYYPNKARAVTPGQVCCLYDKEICLGGGIIKEVYYNDEKRKY